MLDTLKYALALAAFIGVFLLGASISERYIKPTFATKAGTAAVAASQELMKPVEKAAIEGMNTHVQQIQQREQERRDRIAQAREAARPKAYRWKDSAGQWHLSDQPPPEGIAAEVIFLNPN